MKKIIIFISFLFIFSCSNSDIITSNDSNKNEDIIKSYTWVILSLWDSITAWYWLDISYSYPSQLSDLLKENSYNYEVINAWISWDTSKQLKDRSMLYIEKNPDIVIIVIWWNDWLRWLELAQMKNNIQDIIDLYSDKKIILWWMDIPVNLWLKYRNDFKNVYKELANENPDIYFIDFFLEWVAWDISLNLNDRIHPNKEGYSIIVNNLYNFMLKNNLLNK